MNQRSHWPFLLLAFVFALTLKIGVHEGEKLSEQTISARVAYVEPAPDVVVVVPLDRVQVRLRGKINDMAQLNPLTVEVQANLPSDRLGLVPVSLSTSDVRCPPSLEVLSVTPNEFTVELDREITKTVPISFDLVGEPAAGAQVIDSEVRPPLVEIVGPEKVLQNITELNGTVSVERRAITFEERLTVNLPTTVRLARPAPIFAQVRMQEPQLNIDLDPPADDNEEGRPQDD